jgi:hypothetical protein
VRLEGLEVSPELELKKKLGESGTDQSDLDKDNKGKKDETADEEVMKKKEKTKEEEDAKTVKTEKSQKDWDFITPKKKGKKKKKSPRKMQSPRESDHPETIHDVAPIEEVKEQIEEIKKKPRKI